MVFAEFRGRRDAATSERFCGGENKFRLSLKQPAELCPARGQLPAADRPVRRDSFSSWKSPRQSPDVRVSASAACTCRVQERSEERRVGKGCGGGGWRGGWK